MLRTTIFLCLLCLSSYISRAKSLELIPDSKVDANRNAEMMVDIINSGNTVYLEGKTYYIGNAKERIHRRIFIKGPGKLITTSGNNFYVDNSISIELRNVTLNTTAIVKPGTQNRFIVNEGVNYHKKVIIKKCIIEGVRVYTHVAADVDQISIEDGVKKVVFSDNKVSNIGDYILLLTNCKSEKIRIDNNEISRFYMIGFGLGVDNSYKELVPPRIKKVYFRNNYIDNKGLIISDSDEFGSTYMTPFLCEADYCLFENNEIKNVLATKQKPIALYPFYISCRDVIIRNNYIENCLHLTDSRYNEMFKCKSGPKGMKNRIIEGNKYVITSHCLETIISNQESPYIRFTGFQSPEMGDVIIRNNEIDVACNFVFGAGARCGYRSFIFENNRLSYHDIGPSSQQLLRLRPARKGECRIVIRNNVMVPHTPAKDIFGLFLGDCSGYDFFISNNVLSGYLPTGEADIEPSSPSSFSSIGNSVNLGVSNSVIRVSRNVSCDDYYTGGDNYSIFVYPNGIMEGKLVYHFMDNKPVNIMAFTRLPEEGDCEIVVSDSVKESRFSCGVDNSVLYIRDYVAGHYNFFPKGESIKKKYVGVEGNSIGRLITDGQVIYYSFLNTPSDPITIELKYNLISRFLRSQ